jgi:hypothetical protein
VLLIAGLMYVAGCSALFYRWLYANVPLSSRRQAALERRSVDDHVPRVLQHAVSAVIILHLTAWVLVGVTGRYSTSDFWGGLAFQFALSGLAVLLVVGTVRRKPGAMDHASGTAARRTEVRLAFVAQLLPLFNGAARLYEEVAGTRPEMVDRVSHLGLVLFVTVMAMAFGLWTRGHGVARAPWAHGATSTGSIGC